ncbi:MAG: hypothetical protein ACI4WY_04320 [Anaerovoracaceae bacterium]
MIRGNRKKNQRFAGIAAAVITIAGMAVNAPYLIDGSPGWLNVIASAVILISWMVFGAAALMGASDRKKTFSTISWLIGLILVLLLVLTLIAHSAGDGITAIFAVFYLVLLAPVNGIAETLYLAYQSSVDFTGTFLLEPLLCMACYAVVWAACGVVYHLLRKRES